MAWTSAAPGQDEPDAPVAGALEFVQVTATRRSVRDFDVSAAVTQAGADTIRAEAPDVLAEILRGLPGTFFQQTTPGQGIPIIRGLKGSQVLHLVDGMRLNNAFFRDAPNQYLGLVDAFAVDRIEVVRGASGALYGADAMGGVVNVLTPEPAYGGDTWQPTAALYGAWNSADRGWVGRAEAGGGREGLAFSGGVTWQDHGDRRTGDGIRITPSAYRSQAADIKVRIASSDRSEWMLSAQALEQPKTPRVDEWVAGYGQDRPSSAFYWFEPNRRTFVHARFRHDAGLPWVDALEVHAARQSITDDRFNRDLDSPEINDEQNESVLDGLTLQLDSSLPGGHLLTWGAEFYRDEISSTRQRFDPADGAWRAVRARFPDGSRMDSTALYARADWAPGARFTLGTGVRYSAFDIRLPSTSDLEAVQLTPSDLTGDANLLFAVSDTLHLVANIGRGFRPPNIFDLATLGPRPGNRFNVPNPGLGPETVWNYDAGFKHTSAHWDIEVFGFYLDYRDKITSVLTGATTPEGRAVVRSENRNRMRIYGVEAGFRWRPVARTELNGVLNYTRGQEYDNTGGSDNGDRIPPLNGRLGVRFEPAASWTIEGYWLFAAAQDRLSARDIGDPRIDPDGTAGWGTLNLAMHWRVNDVLKLGLKLENLGDVRYREHGSGIDAPGRNLGLWLDAAW